MAKPRTVEDTLGEDWAVYPDDPAELLLRQLDSLALSKVVLPRETLLTGKLPEKTPEVVAIPFHPSLKSVILRAQRAHDCVEFLKRKRVIDGSSAEEV
jgi:hypothetical protein